MSIERELHVSTPYGFLWKLNKSNVGYLLNFVQANRKLNKKVARLSFFHTVVYALTVRKKYRCFDYQRKKYLFWNLFAIVFSK